MYDLCIVGAGLIGSGAARNASLLAGNGLRICLIGPEEASSRRNQSVLSAHYDEGRVTRRVDFEYNWSYLAKQAIGRYTDIEKQSGIQFYNPVGSLILAVKGSEFMERSKAAATSTAGIQLLDNQQVAAKFPFLRVNPDLEGIYDRKGGHVSPRAQVKGLKTAAHLAGCDIINAVVEECREVNEGGSSYFRITTEEHHIIRAKKVLLATGTFTAFKKLLPRGLVPHMQLLTKFTVLVEVTPEDSERLKSMPSISYKENRETMRITAYILPPIKYPDGKFYLKIGHGEQYERELHTHEEMLSWYNASEDRVEGKEFMLDMLLRVVDVKPVSFHVDTCVTARTATDQIYCDRVTPRLGVVMGGCGAAAKSADEIGRMAARMILRGAWDHPLPERDFKAHFRTNHAKL